MSDCYHLSVCLRLAHGAFACWLSVSKMSLFTMAGVGILLRACEKYTRWKSDTLEPVQLFTLSHGSQFLHPGRLEIHVLLADSVSGRLAFIDDGNNGVVLFG